MLAEGTQVSGDAAKVLIKKLGMALNELPTAYDQLWLFILPRTHPPLDGVRVRGVASERVPLDIAVLDLLDERLKTGDDLYPTDVRGRRLGVLPTLSTWVRFTDEELIKDGREYVPPYRFVSCGSTCRYRRIADVDLPGEAQCSGKRLDHWTKKSVRTECAWLTKQLDFIEDQPWCYKITGAITGMLGEVKAIIRDEQDSDLTCMHCGWDVRAMDNGAWYACHGCGRSWSWPALRSMAEARMPITLKEAAERSGTSRSLLLEYISKGKIEALKTKRGTAKLYDPIQIMQVTTGERYRKSPSK